MSSQNDKDLELLQNLLLDVDSLNRLDSSFSKLNFFDVLKIGRTEIRHSNVLSWILDPKENHGLSDSFIKGFFNILIKRNIVKEKSIAIKLLMMNCHNFLIRREWKHVDLILLSEKEKVLVCIENKIDSLEHDNQLERYKKDIDIEFPDNKYTKFFVYLTPCGVESSDSGQWESISYTDILYLLDKLLDEVNLPNDSLIFLTHYALLLRREIVEDEKIIKICNEIYSKHKRALDLIFENRMDFYKQNYEIILNWLEEKDRENIINFEKKISSKSYLRFSSDTLDKIFKPLSENTLSGWNTGRSAYYEINNRNSISIVLSVSSKNITTTSMNNARIILSSKESRKRDFDKNWEWKRLKNFVSKKINEDQDSENTEKIILETLNEGLKKIKKFEKEIILNEKINL